jgi:hypothetical protein
LTITCPQTMDLSGDNHGTCELHLDGYTARQDVYIDPQAGLMSKPLDTFLNWKTLLRKLREAFEQRYSANGIQTPAFIKCPEPHPLVAAAGTVFTCSAVAGGQHFTVRITTVDSLGHSNVSVDPDR